MAKKLYKPKSRGGGKHVQLREWIQVSEAWRTMKVGPRALYIELKRRYNGGNNGEITLSHREAAKALCVTPKTVGPWFRVLESRGFIRKTQEHHLGPSGVGLTAKWAIEEEPTSDMKPARMSFTTWGKPGGRSGGKPAGKK